ncbi:MAG: hypothetical protein H7X99_06285 [Saprospiraceae bacterium]|nr:hypothetical protein [Saprospiraceae bacterium]
MMTSVIKILFLMCLPLFIFGQDVKKSSVFGDSLYQVNIKKSKLYGVYIPRDIDDALSKLMELTTPEARKPMIRVHEDTIARKLHFGLGRWMEYNWNFDEGSRFSHVLREKGLTYTEDMTRFMLIIFHRHVSNKPLNTDKLITKLVEERMKKELIERDKHMLIHQETRKIEKKN